MVVGLRNQEGDSSQQAYLLNMGQVNWYKVNLPFLFFLSSLFVAALLIVDEKSVTLKDNSSKGSLIHSVSHGGR